MPDNLFNVDDLLSTAFKREGLEELFQIKINELKLTKTSVQEILGIPYRTLKGILDGTQKMVDVTNLIKLADFLQVPKERVFELYVESIQKHHPLTHVAPKKIEFIKKNFDLAVLKKAGLIENLNDFEHIESRIIRRLGYRSIFEYQKPEIDAAFSSGLFKPKNLPTRLFWIRSAISTFEEINNPNAYERQSLIKFFPHILWFTMNEDRGLVEVIKALYKIGITVIYQPNLQGLQLRGATFSVNENPCIVLTNYQGFYSTLWFCLIHELYHVLFDWDDIKKDSYHLSDDDNDELTVQEREKQADQFARDYLFSPEKLEAIKRHINDAAYIQKIAQENHVHYSIVYTFTAYESKDRKAWARAKKFSPPVQKAIKSLDFPWTDPKALEEFINEKKHQIYN
jgi:HTH-type transcriptional regulator / antitoxin HigA